MVWEIRLEGEEGPRCGWCDTNSYTLGILDRRGNEVVAFAFCFNCGRGVKVPQGKLPPVIGSVPE